MITELATDRDKLGNEVKVMHSTTLALSPVYTFFLRQTANLIDSGHGLPLTTWEDSQCGAVYVTDTNDKVLGHIVYSREFINKSGYLWIALSAVEEQYRGRGLYDVMHKYFEQVAKEHGCWAIASRIHKDNKVRMASANKVGMTSVFNFMAKKLDA